jgi:hypothetical protein
MSIEKELLLEHINRVCADMELEQEMLAEAGKGNVIVCLILQARREALFTLAEEVCRGSFNRQ